MNDRTINIPLIRKNNLALTHSYILCLLMSLVLAGCTAIQSEDSGSANLPAGTFEAEINSKSACPVTQPEWVLPPDDRAVSNDPEYGYYFVNQDRSIWASSWWTGQDYTLRVSAEGIKVGWYRPEGAALEITGQRLGEQAPALEANIPCCYPTRFQSSGLFFPTGGCWEVNAKAAQSELSFVVWIEP